LETIIPDPEWRERGRPREIAQDALSRFIAFHPALFFIVSVDTARLLPVSITMASVSGRSADGVGQPARSVGMLR
jgi:hypothetical protein